MRRLLTACSLGARAPRRRWLAALVLLVAGAAPAGAVTEENFRLRSGADLIALCEAAPGESLAVAAIQMCQGFGVGVYQTLVALGSSEKVDDFFCPPDPQPTRDEAFARFRAWARLPETAPHLSESPAALVGRFLIVTYPCAKPAASGGGR